MIPNRIAKAAMEESLADHNHDPSAKTYCSYSILLPVPNKQGFSLDEIQQFLPPDPRQWNHAKLLSLLQTKIEDIEALEVKLAANKARLKSILKTIQDKPADVSCEANAEKVFKDHLA